MSVRVALVGCGRWGEKLLRALSQSARAAVVAVADLDRARLARARALAPKARLVRSLDEALALRVDAVVIATPPATHAELTLRALDRGADVFVEKPLALSPAQADRCADRAAALGRVGMVGHLLRYHPAVAALIALARERRLGELASFASSRLATNGVGAGSALWTLGPHDLSVLVAIDPSPLCDAWAQLSPCGERVTLEARLESGLAARIDLSRAGPARERSFRLDGASRVALFDDVRAPDRIVLAEPRGSVHDPRPSVEDVRVPWREPLAIEVEHFLRCVEERGAPLTPLDEGAAIVRMLARFEATLSPARAVAVG